MGESDRPIPLGMGVSKGRMKLCVLQSKEWTEVENKEEMIEKTI